MKRVGEGLLELVANPPEGLRWTCPLCGVTHVNSVPPENGICQGCHRIRAPQRLSREQVLEAGGVPRRHWRPFVEPGPAGLQPQWPIARDGRDCREWLRHGWCLLLTGSTGSGKSALAAELLLRAAADLRCSPRWARAQDLADMVLGGKRDEARQTIESPLLVVDELGIGHESDAAWSAVEGGICRRWEQELPTILTTNLGGKALQSRAPLVDRMRDGMACRLDGASVRGQGR